MPQFLDSAGKPFVDALIYYYFSGTNTFQDTFQDVNLSIPNTNPVRLLADARLPNVWLKDASYNILVTGTDSVTGLLTQIWQRDPVGGESETGNWSVWNSLTIYGSNDIVEGSDGFYYISIIEANQGNDPLVSPTSWSQIRLNYVWNVNQTYALNDLVQGSDGTLYSSLINGNLGNDPVTDIINWQSASSLDVPNIILAAGRTFAYNNF